MKLTPEQATAARALLRANDESFLALLRTAGLDPAIVLPGADLRGVVFTAHDDLTGLDLTGLELSGCDLRGTDLTQAIGVERAIFTNVTTDARTKGLPPPSPPPDFDLDLVHAMIRGDETPPRPWWPFITELKLGAVWGKDAPPELSDLRPLAPLTALRSLDLSGTQVSDVTVLGGLSALQTLYLRGTHVSDVTALGGLSALETLTLSTGHSSKGLAQLLDRGVRIDRI